MKIAFLDRDGVINKEIGYLYKINDFEYTHKCIDGLKILNKKGFEIVIITNQAGIAKGYFTEKDYKNLTNWYLEDLKNQSVSILRTIYCPHHKDALITKYKKVCSCRKPNIGMIEKVTDEFDVDLKSSILIGDKKTDIKTGQTAGIGACYYVRSEETPENIDAFNNLYELASSL